MKLSPLLLAVAVPAAAVLALRLFPNAKIFWLLRRDRTRAGHRSRDLELAAAFHSRLGTDPGGAGPDDRAWRDLDLDAVFLGLDRSESLPGQQYLYRMLHTTHGTAASLERFERAVSRIGRDPVLAAPLRAVLSRLANPRAGRLVQAILDTPPARPPFWWVIPILAIGSVASLVAAFTWPWALVVLAVIVLANIGVQLAYRRSVLAFVPAVREMPGFLRVAAQLGDLQVEELAAELACLREGGPAMASLRHATRWMVAEPAFMSELAAMLFEYANMFFLLDVNAFMFTTASLRESQPRLRAMYEAVGYIDAALSVATWRAELPRWTTPRFTGRAKAARLGGVVHPLLEDPVPNGVAVEGAGLLITGSNMSGKSTFLRAVGVNAVLAQALNTVCAEEWSAPMLVVRTSIGRSDSLADGKSYYLAEVESVGALITASESGRQHLFLLDEIFRGTNTSERVAAGYAVLAHLTQGDDIVIVATHDLELIPLLGAAYAPFHFREELANGSLTFDYRIRPGPSSTRNAIALLEHMRFPGSVVQAARTALDRRGGSS